jgi:hypothetical protein
MPSLPSGHACFLCPYVSYKGLKYRKMSYHNAVIRPRGRDTPNCPQAGGGSPSGGDRLCCQYVPYAEATHPLRVTSAPMAHQGRERHVAGRRRHPPYPSATLGHSA